jgi:hypothetical protein
VRRVYDWLSIHLVASTMPGLRSRKTCIIELTGFLSAIS